MNILYILPTLFRGGAEKSTLYLASRMQALGNTVSLLAIRAGGSLVNDFQASGIRVSVRKNLRERMKELLPQRGLDIFYRAQRGRYRMRYAQQVKLPPPKHDPSLERWVKQKLNSIAPDVVHVHQSLCVETLRWAKECGVARVVYSPHEIVGEYSDKEDIRRINNSVKWADWITFVSNAQRRDFLENVAFPRKRTCVIPPQTSFKGNARTVRDAPPPLILGTMSNLSPVKDPPTLLHAIHVLRREGKDVRLRIAGGDPRWKPVVEQTVNELKLQDHVRFIGELETDADIQAFYDSLDVYVSTSISESFGLTMKEAMECGLAVVSSDTIPANEFVANKGTGLIFRRGNVDELVSRIRFFLRHPEKASEMGRFACKYVLRKFSHRDTSTDYHRIYVQMLHP